MRAIRLPILVATLSVISLGAYAGDVGKPAPVKIAPALMGPGYTSGLIIAQKRGFFREEGLDLEILGTTSAEGAMTALASGDAHLALVPADGIVVAHALGNPLIAVYPAKRHNTIDLIIRKNVAAERKITRNLSLKERVERLKGLKFGTSSKGGPFRIYPYYLIYNQGFDPFAHIQTAYMGAPPNFIAALEAGQVDLICLSKEDAQRLIQEGKADLLVDFLNDKITKQAPNFLVSLYATTRTYYKANAETLRKVARAIRRTDEWVLKNSAESLKILQEYWNKRPPAYVEAGFERSYLAGMSAPGFRFSAANFEAEVEVLIANKLITKGPDTKEGGMWTNEFIPR